MYNFWFFVCYNISPFPNQIKGLVYWVVSTCIQYLLIKYVEDNWRTASGFSTSDIAAEVFGDFWTNDTSA